MVNTCAGLSHECQNVVTTNVCNKEISIFPYLPPLMIEKRYISEEQLPVAPFLLILLSVKRKNNDFLKCP